MLINFTKMHGLGNDFVIIDLISQNIKLNAQDIKRIADRHFGIGCDQVLLLEPPLHKQSDFFYRIYNANGKEAEHCGNGARCIAALFYELGYTNRKALKADCRAGEFTFELEGQEVSVNMGQPIFTPSAIPFDVEKEALTYSLQLPDKTVDIVALSFGNPHAILEVDRLEDFQVKKWGSLISKHERFPNETNVEFMQIRDRQTIDLRVFERGVGETLACGTGACAAAVAGIRLQKLNNLVTVQFPAGSLSITWEGLGSPLLMKGPVSFVFTGQYRL